MSRRAEKVAELVKRLVSELIQEAISEEMGMITVMDVQISDDLRNAIIYICVAEKDNEAKVLEILEEKTSEFQRFLGKKLEIRFAPKLTFKIDKSLTEINHIEELLKEIDRGA